MKVYKLIGRPVILNFHARYGWVISCTLRRFNPDENATATHYIWSNVHSIADLVEWYDEKSMALSGIEPEPDTLSNYHPNTKNFTYLFRTPYTGRNFLCWSNVPGPGCVTLVGPWSSLGFFGLLLKFTKVVDFFVGNLENIFPTTKLYLESILIPK